MGILDIKNLTFAYEGAQDNVLKNVNMTIEEGDIVLLCGPSAEGKTTLLKLVKHLIAPAGICTGDIMFKNENINNIGLVQLAAEIGYVSQNPDTQLVCDEPFAEIAFGLENIGTKSDEIRRRVAETAAFLGIDPFFDTKIAKLSGGQKQLLNLASVMCMNPKLLLLDEPTAMLDPIATEEFYNTLIKLNRELGMTIIICEHQLDKIYPLVDKVCIMENKTITFQGDSISGASHIVYQQPNFIDSMPVPVKLSLSLGRESSIPLDVRSGRRIIDEIDKKSLHASYDRIVNGEKVLQVKHVYFKYEKTGDFILKDINMVGYASSIISIVGSNGAGKSTLMSLISGYKKPLSGKIKVEDIALLPQDIKLCFEYDTVGEEICEFKKKYKINDELANRMEYIFPRIKKIIKDKNKNPLDLSGGESQMLALYKISMLGRKIMLLDEPVKGLDGRAKKELQDLIRFIRDEGCLVIVVTHDLEFAASVSDQVSMMFRGEIVSTQSRREFFTDNKFYTTSMATMTRGLIEDCVTIDDFMNMYKVEKSESR